MRTPTVVRKTASSAAFMDSLMGPLYVTHPEEEEHGRTTWVALTGRFNGRAVLNLGGVGMDGAVNFDVDAAADIQGDAHDLSFFADGEFDVVISTGMLQYCERPDAVVDEVWRVLRPGGLVYFDVPFVQPYCDHHGVADLWRFTPHGLLRLFDAFEVEDSGSSIPAVSALGYYLTKCEGRSRYLSAAWRLAVSLIFAPLAWTKLGRSPNVAGALYLIARRPVRPLDSERVGEGAA